jgi:hypothetical protein
LLGRIHDKQNQEIITWLSPLNFFTNQDDYFDRRREGTGNWLLDSNIFKAWLDGTNKTLWCPGIRMFSLSITFPLLTLSAAGAGKTILAYDSFYF